MDVQTRREILAGMQPRAAEPYRPQRARAKRRALCDEDLAVGMAVEIRGEPWWIAGLLVTESGRLVVIAGPTPENAFYDALRYDEYNWPRYLTELDEVRSTE